MLADILTDYFNDACYQALAYWIMSAITNDPFRLARFAGLYKAIQSAGGAGSFGMDAVAPPYLNELVSRPPFDAYASTSACLLIPYRCFPLQLASWIMMLVSFPLAYIVIRTIKETNYEDEKVVFVDDLKSGAVEAGHSPVEPEKASIAET
jgi:hypothetical protein